MKLVLLPDQNNNSMDTVDSHASFETPHIYHSSEEIAQGGIVNDNGDPNLQPKRFCS